MKRICLAGGDVRMDEASLALQNMGYETLRAREALPRDLDALVLPVRYSTDREYIAGTRIALSEIGSALVPGGRVIGGMLPADWIGCYDYMKDEAFLYENARITAEGAIMLLGNATRGTLYGSDVGVIGMGRIAEHLCIMLGGIGARVTVYARRPEALARARALGACAVRFTHALPDCVSAHGMLCNTVPHVLMDAWRLDFVSRDTVLLELASAPGGFDMEAVRAKGLCFVDGQGIPGKYAPRAAGRLIAKYVASIARGDR